ncbi:MAG TPA: class I SAM-dependent methyltransferase [Steroidobacteraceae bacterium]|nr:class I SAM-dependent methyltransferase [Steroidobacteraceae bacterium]
MPTDKAPRLGKKAIKESLFRRVPRRLFTSTRRAFGRYRYRNHFDARRLDLDWTVPQCNRIAIVNLLLAKRPHGKYLEIGCAGNEMFDSVIAMHKTGVDPARGGTVRLTSDEFFRSDDGTRYDVIFIDGLHTYQQVRRDVINSLSRLAKGGWIALHDMLPRDWLEEHVPRISDTWTGDVWKMAFELSQSVDIDFRIIKVDMGVGVLRPLRESAQLLDLGPTLADKRFPYLFDHIDTLPLLDHATARQWIEQAVGQESSDRAYDEVRVALAP